jgi:hypothetical protein
MSYLVLHVRSYSFEADDGRPISGASVTYLDLEAPPSALAPNEYGLAPLTVSAPSRMGADFTTVPGVYQLHFHQRRGKGGKPVVALGGATLERSVDLARV